jgi:hypothetical protein
MRVLSLSIAWLLLLPAQVSGFAAPTAKSAIKPADQAVVIYQTKYPDKGPRKRAWNSAAGMNPKDLDGTTYSVAKTAEMGKTFADRNEKDLKACFQDLSKVFGTEDALQMVKDFPIVLAITRKDLQPVMKAFSETFGEEDAAAMVKRNPGLLFLRPPVAATADDLTMKFSYIIAFTRPVGPLILVTLLALVCEPAFESFSGIPLKQMIFG